MNDTMQRKNSPAHISASRGSLAQALRLRSAEIEQAITDRIRAIGETDEWSDPEYVDSSRAAVGAGVEYGLRAIELGVEASPFPISVLAHARVASRHGVPLKALSSRLFAAHHVLCEMAFRVAEGNMAIKPADLTEILRSQAALSERLHFAIGEEYERETRTQPVSSQARLADRVKRLLDGELVDPVGIDYYLEGNHVGLVAEGARCAAAIRTLASELGARALIVHPGGDTVWGWLGSRHALPRDHVGLAIDQCWPAKAPVGVGESDTGRAGWRLTHRQAKDVAPLARCNSKLVAHYRDDGIVAAAARDEILSSSLQKMYAEPLGDGRCVPDAVATLRAYFRSGRNAAAAAAGLGVSRQTIGKRLRLIEERIGRDLRLCGAELEIALRLTSLRTDPRSTPRRASNEPDEL